MDESGDLGGGMAEREDVGSLLACAEDERADGPVRVRVVRCDHAVAGGRTSHGGDDVVANVEERRVRKGAQSECSTDLGVVYESKEAECADST